MLHNDDPINLRDSAVEASEGDVIELVVVRGGQANGKCVQYVCACHTGICASIWYHIFFFAGVAEVSFQVTYTSASADDVVITPSSGIVTLANGETEAIITIEVVNDTIPEESESLRVDLTSTTGDAVLVTPTTATVDILPSDDPNGVFQFAANSRELTAEEGDTLQLM